LIRAVKSRIERLIATLMFLLLSGCASTSPGVTAHSPAVSSLPPISPAPVATAPACNLPIYWSTTIMSNTIHAGFFHYPEGGVQGDIPMTEDPSSQSFFESMATYDRAVNRWLPVAASGISPDGLRFAFADYNLPPTSSTPIRSSPLGSTGRIHVMDARTGADKVVFSGSPTFSVVAFTSSGLYLSQVAPTRVAMVASGLFLLDPAGGAPRPVPGADRPLDQAGWHIFGEDAWGVDFASGGGLLSGNRVLRLDLKTGEVQAWKTWDEGVLTNVLGLDAQGHVIVGAFPPFGAPSKLEGLQVWTFSAPNVGTLVYKSTNPIATLPDAPAFTDGHVAWLGGNAPPSNVWRLTTETGMTRIPISIAGTLWVGVGGACI
jgi:hypothetical protein